MQQFTSMVNLETAKLQFNEGDIIEQINKKLKN